MTEINDFVQWLDENPDPDLVDVYAVPETLFHDEEFGRMEEWVANGWRDAPGDVTETISVDVLSETFRGRAALLDMVVKSTASTRIDESGAVVEEIPERPYYRFSIQLIRDPEMGWRIGELIRVEEWTD